MTDDLIARTESALENAAGFGDGRPSRAITAELLALARENKARIEALGAALEDMLQSTCGPTGFAEAIRHNSGFAYPWPSLDLAEMKARAALKGSTP